MSSDSAEGCNNAMVDREPSKDASTSCDVQTPCSGKLTIRFLSHSGLGNHMFMYAGLMGISKVNNLVPFIYNNKLESIFELGESVKGWPEEPDFSALKTVYEDKICAYDNRFENLSVPKDGTLAIYAYLQSWRYFEHCRDEVRRHFRFKDVLMDKVNSVFLSSHIGPEETLVAVHIRRGDLLGKKWVDKGYLVPDHGYFRRAMMYFRDKFPRVKFLVCSNDMLWAKGNITAENGDVDFVCGNAAEVDLAVMSHCHHCIMSVGTFGWWAGWLTGGEVVYYKTPAIPGSEIDEHFVYTDHYPTEWIAME